MVILVSGGASSGKSAWAEKIACNLGASHGGLPLFYLATLDKKSGGDTPQRILRHRALRSGKGFDTLELCVSLDGFHLSRALSGGNEEFVALPSLTGSTVLLEDMGNLVARAVFSNLKSSPDNAVEQFLESLSRICMNLVVVTNEIFLEELNLADEGMGSYYASLARANRIVGKMARTVYHVVAGIPLEL
ncbi:MAG: bifunctional adenosylcobinamide kinase/adenosylcobinamide-phosphate guanylyltransferase [Treponema sp.]|nr:bifunctional adenosylcobinamide kinase/adenosylcobinamide-phosphate guanylyltransferase [Treponema sp.]